MTWITQTDGSPEIHKYRNIPNMKEDHWKKWTMFAREQMGKSRTDKYIYITNSKGVIFNPQIWKSLLLLTEWAKIWKPARTTEQFETKKSQARSIHNLACMTVSICSSSWQFLWHVKSLYFFFLISERSIYSKEKILGYLKYDWSDENINLISEVQISGQTEKI